MLKSLIIRQYYCVFHLRFGNKFTPTKLLCTRKWMIFLEEKAKSHGNADAYRGFLTHYYGKSAVFGQFLTMAHTRRVAVFYFFSCFISEYANSTEKVPVAKDVKVGMVLR